MTGKERDDGTRSKWSYAAILAQLTEARPFNEAARFAGDVSVELYAPVGEDRQTPHTRDELYIIATGSGSFVLEDESFPFEAGDLIFVPAHAEHRFSTFSDDFSTWVIFFGPEKPSPV